MKVCAQNTIGTIGSPTPLGLPLSDYSIFHATFFSIIPSLSDIELKNYSRT